MYACKKGVILKAFYAKNKLLVNSRNNSLLSHLQSNYAKSSSSKAGIANRCTWQGLQCIPAKQNIIFSNYPCSQSVAFHSMSLTWDGRDDTLLYTGLKVRENCAEFHSNEDRTYVTILNREETAPLMVDAYSQQGFRMNSGLAVVGAIAMFRKSLFSWNVGSAAGITRESLSLFHMLVPKIDLVVLGIGDPGTKFDVSLLPFMRDKGISLEVLSTEKAVATYNFLVEEGRSVAGAFIPPQALRPTAEDQADAIMKKRQLFETTIQDEIL